MHFGHAAKKFFVSQPALSQQIRLLEAELGVELFIGVKRIQLRKVELTEAGSIFLKEARHILQLAEKAVIHVRQIGAREQVVTLGVFKLILPERIMGMLELFSTHFPAIQVQIVELPNPVQVQKYVSTGLIDLGMSVLPLTSDNLIATEYTQADYTILMKRDHPLAHKRALKLEELKHEKWIDHGPETGLYFEQLEEACHRAGFHRQSNIIHFEPSFDLMKSMVRLGKGIAFIPATLDLEQEPKLCAIPIIDRDGTPFKEVVIQHTLIHKSGQATPPCARAERTTQITDLKNVIGLMILLRNLLT